MKKLFLADKVLITTFLILLALGLMFFLSASLGILASNTEKFTSIIKTQLLLGFLGGIIAFLIVLKLPSVFWQKYAAVFFVLAMGLTALVYIPGLSMEHGGARRWIDIGPISLQPAEFLKAAVLIYLSALYAKILRKKKEVDKSSQGINLFQLLAPALIILFLCASILLPQPDTKSTVLIFLVTASLLYVAGLPYRIVFSTIGIFVILGAFLVATKPYVRERFDTYLNPENDLSGSSYQLNQSKIALGSGGVLGQGYGQSIQKFNYLPEPHGDSIFAVVGEEIGFIGSVVVILLYLVFILRGIKLSKMMDTPFARLYFIGFFSLFAFQTFLNIGSATGVIPLTGVPLPLMSHGGTSMMINLALFGLIVRLLYEKNKLVV
jgi:cell division protein FtsW